jgi:hypothetical protein
MKLYKRGRAAIALLYSRATRRAELQRIQGRECYPDEIALTAGCQDGDDLLRWSRMEALQRLGLLWISRVDDEAPYVRLTPCGVEEGKLQLELQEMEERNG